MFDLCKHSHDQIVANALKAISATSRHAVAQAFLASLSTRRLDLRSALGSYAIGRNMNRHGMASRGGGRTCAYCGTFAMSEIDPSILNFERLKWGGVRHHQPEYMAFDLELLAESEILAPQEQDYSILRAILETARSMPESARPGDLDKALAKLLPSNSAERRTLIGILGYAGILVDPLRSDFRRQFVAISDREETPWIKDDWPYPVCWWRGAHGVNDHGVREWFGAACG